MMKSKLLIIAILCACSSMIYSFDRVTMVQESSNVYALDKELRSLEKEQIGTVFPLIQSIAQERGSEFFENFVLSEITSDHQAWEYRYIFVPIFYKLGMTELAASLAQATFEYLFPELHFAINAVLQGLFGQDYFKTAMELVGQYVFPNESIDSVSYRIKSTHSIWKKMESLEAFERMTQEEFASCVNDFIGIRWEMKVLEDSNRYDALINGVRLSPSENLKTFRNQMLSQKSGFASEPVMKLCYTINGFPVELQLLGGNMTGYMSAKGYADYKTKLSLTPRTDDSHKQRRLQMAAEIGDQAAFCKYMFEELIGQVPDYSNYDPFVLDELPRLEENRTLNFPDSSTPICELANLSFEGE